MVNKFNLLAKRLLVGLSLSAAAVGPVSYTHLDVYKRQPLSSSGKSSTRPSASHGNAEHDLATPG